MRAPSSVALCSFPNCEDHSMTVKAARATTQNYEAKDHNLVADALRESVSKNVRYEKRPVKGMDG